MENEDKLSMLDHLMAAVAGLRLGGEEFTVPLAFAVAALETLPKVSPPSINEAEREVETVPIHIGITGMTANEVREITGQINEPGEGDSQV